MSCSACTAPECREKPVKSDEFSRAKLSQAQTRISCNSLQTLVFVYLSEGVDPNPRHEIKHIKVAAKLRKMLCFMAPYLRHLAALSAASAAASFHYRRRLWRWHFILRPRSSGPLRVTCHCVRATDAGDSSPASSSPRRQDAVEPGRKWMTKRGRVVWFSPADGPAGRGGMMGVWCTKKTKKKNRNADTFTDRVMNAAVRGALNCIQSRSAVSRGETKAFSHRCFPPVRRIGRSSTTASRTQASIIENGDQTANTSTGRYFSSGHLR